MKKILIAVLLFAFILPSFGQQNVDEFKFSLVPRRVAQFTLPLSVANGGTGLASYAVGDLLYASGATALSKLAAVATGQVLVSAGTTTAPAWSESPTLTGTLTANNLTASPTLSNEALTNVAGWTAAGTWTYAGGKWSHATGSATALTATGETAIAVGTKYEIVMTLSSVTVAGGGLAVSLGGQSFVVVSADGAYTFNVTALSTAALAITPTSGTWVGSLTISVKLVTNGQLNADGITLNSGQLLLPNGNATYPALSFARSGKGLYTNAAGSVMYCTANYFVPTISMLVGSTYYSDGEISGQVTLQLGADAASPVDQTLKAHDASGNDGVGAMLTLQGGQNKGSGAGGSYRIQTAYTGASASTAGVEYTRQHINGKVHTVDDNTTTAMFSIALADGNAVGGYINYTVEVTDGTDFQVESGTFTFAAVNKATETWTTDADKGTYSQAVSASTLTVTWAVDTATADTFKVTINSNSGLTPTSTKVQFQIFLNSPKVITIL